MLRDLTRYDVQINVGTWDVYRLYEVAIHI